MSSVKEFYDKFSEEQEAFGINKRHLSIHAWLQKFGMQPESDILEIGCGIGTQTELTSKFLKNGFITAVDISPKNIEIAKERLKEHKNVSLSVLDITEGLEMTKKFDIILLPDVLEHIPIGKHFALFKNLKMLLKTEGFILVHIPDPYYLKWISENRPETMQIIDQSIYTNILVDNVYPHDLTITYLNSYSIWTTQADYQVIVIKNVPQGTYTFKSGNPGFFSKVKYKLGIR